jgi:phosphate-selective porin OprO/OprP
MKKLKILTFSKCLLAFAFSVNGQSEETSTYDMLWIKVSLYENEKNPLIRKFVLTARLQGDYHSFENDETGESASDFDWRRFRFGFKASILDGFTLHSEANLNLNQPEPLYTNLTDTYLSWSTDNGLKFKVGKQSAPFTLDGSTSSKKLHSLERGKIATNVCLELSLFPNHLSELVIMQ